VAEIAEQYPRQLAAQTRRSIRSFTEKETSHARDFTAPVAPEKIDEFIQLWHDALLPSSKEEKGWKSARLLVDRQSGKAILISLWETEVDAAASRTGSAHAQKIHAIIGHLLAGRPVKEYCELAGDA
jgi:quinol monooxygenase YgiN